MPDIVPLRPERRAHARALVELLDHYAREPSGGGSGLPPGVLDHLAERLASLPHYLGFLALEGREPVGLVNCFLGFSTFAARPLINVHDLVVLAGRRRQGIGSALLRAVFERAREADCCKVTLEVLEGNAAAIEAYRRLGFHDYELDPAMGRAVFMEKPLD